MDLNQPFEPGSSGSRGLRLGSLAGVTVRLHWMLLIFLGMVLLLHYLLPTPPEHPFLSWLLFAAAVALSLGLHELAHLWAASRHGEPPGEILLWPLGDLTEYPDQDEPTIQFWVAGAGPIADALKLGLAATICWVADWGLLPEPGTEAGWALRLFVQDFFLWNAILLVHNVLPCTPLDGGRILEAAKWSSLGTRGEGIDAASKVGRIIAFVALGCAAVLVLVSLPNKDFAVESPFLFWLGWGLIFAGVFHFHEARLRQHRMEYSQQDEGIFGYDFSAGYTSLERTVTRERKGSLVGALSERYHQHESAKKSAKEEEQKAAMREELDRVLAKIHEQGLDSLSRREKLFLEEASRQLRE